MGQDTSQLRVGLTGAIYLAPVGTAEPDATLGAWPAGWVDLGLVDEDGMPEFTPSTDVTPHRLWQKTFPGRYDVTGRSAELTFTLAQKTGTNLKLAFGGGTITALAAPGDFKYAPPAPTAGLYEKAVGLEVVDGAIIDRYVLRRAFVSDVGAIEFKKDTLTKFPLTVSPMEPDAGDVWVLAASNDPALAS